MAKKKFYAVAKGRKSGIYTSWPEAEAQVKGFGGAKYKGFVSRSDAEAWMEDPQWGATKTKKRSAGKVCPRQVAVPSDHIVIYTDGGAINNPGPGGYGVVIQNNGVEQELSGGYRLTTNNRMELMACIKALRTLGSNEQPASLYSDSSYVVNGISKGWAKGWRKRGWKKSDGQPAMNADLWADLLQLTENKKITFNWVRGHSGNPLNERCDQLAVANARKENLPEDIGYTS